MLMVDSSLFNPDEEMKETAPVQQQEATGEFMFMQTLALHQGAVRSVSTLDSGYMLSGSIDTSSKLFILNNATGIYDFDKEINYHTGFVYATCPSQSDQLSNDVYRVLGDGFFTGGKDGKMFKVDLMGNPLMIFEGHESAVNSISQCIPEEVVTGSWDGTANAFKHFKGVNHIISGYIPIGCKKLMNQTAKIWDVETGTVKHTLPGHSHAVAVLTMSNGITVTGSQDKKIRIWFKGNLEREYEAHQDIIRQFAELPGIGFVSCSNDETIKLWTIDGQKLAELKGHTGYVFSVCVLDSGEIASASDDRTVRIWRDNKCLQVITHPRTVWCVTKNHLGDIITGGEDYKMRTFTRDPTRRDSSVHSI